MTDDIICEILLSFVSTFIRLSPLPNNYLALSISVYQQNKFDFCTQFTHKNHNNDIWICSSQVRALNSTGFMTSPRAKLVESGGELRMILNRKIK